MEENPKRTASRSKIPLHLFPSSAVMEGALAMLNGVLKYGRNNFRVLPIKSSVYVSAAKRHLDEWFEGVELDPVDGIPSLGAALACIAIIIDARAAGTLDDDRNIEGGYSEYRAYLESLIPALLERHKDKNSQHLTIVDNKKEGETA